MFNYYRSMGQNSSMLERVVHDKPVKIDIAVPFINSGNKERKSNTSHGISQRVYTLVRKFQLETTHRDARYIFWREMWISSLLEDREFLHTPPGRE
jgi:hypothetical protein